MVLYHGSEKIIERPVFHGGNRHNDYGYGFYCTESPDLGREWSVDEKRDGFLNTYELKMDGLSVLNLNNGEYTVLHWLAILLENRVFPITAALAKEGRRYILDNFSVPYGEADVMIGYRADDSYFSFASDFLNGTISVQELGQAMQLGHLGEQAVLKSRAAFDKLEYRCFEPVSAGEWFIKKKMRDEDARRSYFRSDKTWKRGRIYLPQILEQEIGAEDERIQRIIY